MDVIKKLEWRYAVKKFDEDKLLSEEKLNKLIQAFNLTATSYGLQPIKLLVVQNKELQKKLMSHSYGQQQVAQASHVFVICIEKHIGAEYIRKYFNRVKQLRNTKDEILDPFKGALIETFSKKEINEVRSWATNQAYLALGTLMTVCAIEDIDACPMEGFDPVSYDKALGLKEKELTSVLALPIGYRAQDDMFATLKKVRKELDESVIRISE